MTEIRRAVVQRNEASGRPTASEVENYLPGGGNYKVVSETDTEIVIEGTDNAGWTLDDYVIPRLGSGLITAREV